MGQVHTKYKMIVVSGASGVGKTTLLHMIENDLGIPLVYLSSVTTRERRASDERGIRYVTEEAFTRMEDNGEFLWTKHVHGHRKGTRKEDVANVKTASSLVATILTPDRLPHLYDALMSLGVPTHEVLFIHIQHPGEAILRARLEERGDSPEKIQIRIEECREWDAFVYALPFSIVMFDNTCDKEVLIRKLQSLFSL